MCRRSNEAVLRGGFSLSGLCSGKRSRRYARLTPPSSSSEIPMALNNKNVFALLPQDADGNPIQVLAPGAITNEAVGGSSSALAIPTGAEVVEVGISADAWVLWGLSGGSVANTTGMFFPKGSVVWRVPTGATHLAHIQDSEAGRISITKLV